MKSAQRFIYAICLVLPLSALRLSGQQATSGPTLQETIGFINDTYGKQPILKVTENDATYTYSDIHVEPNGACSMAITERTSNNYVPKSDGTQSYELSLEKTDPLSVAVEPRGSSGFSIAANGVTRSLPITPKDKAAPAIQITPESHRGEETVFGVISSLRPDELEFISNQGVLYRILATDVNDITLFAGLNKKSTWHAGEEHNFSHFSPYQRVIVFTHTTTSGKGKKQTEVVTEDVTSYPPTTSYQKVALPPLASNDTANRMAKALIHAVVLCHKDEKPPLF